MQQQYLFIMLGFLGSGKSFVSRWLAPHTGAVYLRADALRLAMFGEDRPELYTPENKALVNNAQAYAIQQILAAGQSVIHDANNNSYKTRQEHMKMAREHSAMPIVVWIDTPLDVAEERTEIRKVTEGHELFAPNLVRTMAARLEKPHDNERVIRIDGLASQEQQQQQFNEQLAKLTA